MYERALLLQKTTEAQEHACLPVCLVVKSYDYEYNSFLVLVVVIIALSCNVCVCVRVCLSFARYIYELSWRFTVAWGKGERELLLFSHEYVCVCFFF